MALAVCVFVTWISIILISLLPKALSGLDMIFLLFVNTIFVISVFSVFGLNLKYFATMDVFTTEIGIIIYRMVAIPLVLIISANEFQYKASRWGRFVILCATWLFLIFMDHVFNRLGIIRFIRWNLVDSAIVYVFFIVFSNCMAWLIVKVGRKEANRV